MTNQDNKAITVPNEKELPKAIIKMAEGVDMLPQQYWNTVMHTAGIPTATFAQQMTFMLTAKRYDLDPLIRQIYAFSARGKIVPIVPIDGWLKLINDHTALDGIITNDNYVDGKLFSVTCTIHRKDRKYPTTITEYLSECDQGTDPWKKMAARMLRHKAIIQCARVAFAIGAGIFDPEEGAVIANSVTPQEAQEQLNDHLSQIPDAEIMEPKKETQPPSDWESITDELLIGIDAANSAEELQAFFEENVEYIKELENSSDRAAIQKYLNAVTKKRNELKE